MMTAADRSTPTALDLLFGPDAEAAAAKTLAGEMSLLGGGQDLDHALADLPETVRQAAAQEAGTTMAALLQVDLIGVLVRGWREHQDIVSAARRTLAVPGSTELVSMSALEVTLDQQPSVSVLLDGQQVASIDLGLSIVFDVAALLLGISGGLLVAVRSGRCEITAILAVQGTDLLVKHARLELPGVISLQQGIRLLPVAEYPASENSAGEYPGSDPRGGEYLSRVHQVGEYPADDPSAPWWQSAGSIPRPDRRT
jgi:hypothetical protein